MKLSLSLICERLREKYPRAQLYGDGMALSEAVMLFGGQELSESYIYIVSADDVQVVEACAGKAVFICPLTDEDLSGCDAIVLNESVSVLELLNDVTTIFLSMNRWDEALSLCPNSVDGICRMLDLASDLMGGYLWLVDAYYNYPAKSISTAQYAFMFDPEDSSRPSQEILRSLVEDPVITQIVNKKGATLYYGNGGNEYGSSLFVNLFREGEYGFSYRILFVRRDSKYLAWHYHILEHLAMRIQRNTDVLSLYDHSGKEQRNLKNLLLNMLEDREQNSVVISANLQAVSWSSEDCYEVWVFYPFIPGQSPGSNTYILSFLEKTFHSSCALLLDDTIVMLRNATRSVHKPETVRDQMIQFLKENLYKVGISIPTEHFGQIRSAYIQAQNAYRLGSARHPHYWYYKFEDYVLDYVVYKSTEEVPATMLCPKELKVLQEYDETNNTELLRSLKVYMQEKYNATHAAQKLYIHRTTFLDRLERIGILTQLNLDNTDVRLALMLAFRMMET